MDKAQVIWLFMLFNILTYSADGNTCTAEIEDFRTSKQQKEPKPMYGTITESSKPCIQRTFPELHAVQRTTVSRLLKVIYRGPPNSRPPNVRNSSNSSSIKPSSSFMAALKHLLIGLLLIPCFF